jgi:hypothetical protein
MQELDSQVQCSNGKKDVMRKIKIISGAVILILVVASIVSVHMFSRSEREPYLCMPVSLIWEARRECHKFMGLLYSFYTNNELGPFEDINEAFSRYASKGSGFSIKEPPENYKHEQDFAFYLLLPEKFESSRPMLIAYTDARADFDGRLYRFGFILQGCGAKIALIQFEDNMLRHIVGDKLMNEASPNFYWWLKGATYRKDQQKKRQEAEHFPGKVH